jgi:hypothetical protein
VKSEPIASDVRKPDRVRPEARQRARLADNGKALADRLVHQAPASHVFVQVTNPAQRPLHLTKLDYVFASSKGTTLSEGSMPIERDIPGGAVAVLEVPLDAEPTTEPVTLRGKLTGELDQIVRTFKLNAQISTAEIAR